MTDVAVEPSTYVEPVTYVASNGAALQVGDRVHVSVSLAKNSWDYSNFTLVPGRKFDFGTVEELNQDGTVRVFWDGAGCSCTSEEVGRNENASELTLATEETEALWDVVYDQAFDEGLKANQKSLREALGLDN
jgi:hypothetical protein